MGNLRDGDTILLAEGVYNLSSSLYVNGRDNVTIRGQSGSAEVVLAGKGMDNSNHGGVLFGIWSNSRNTTVAHLTIRDTYDNAIIFNSGAQSPRVYSVRLIDAGSQFIKSNPTDANAGLGVDNGVVEYCWFEYTERPPGDHGSGAGYFNGISAHAAKNWVVRRNVFKNLHNPDGSAYPWNPSVLFWRNSSNTITEQNIFVNVDRAIACGLDNGTPYRDHSGGVVRNNFVYLKPELLSAARRASSDGSIIVWNSPGTRVDHNTLLLNGNLACAIEFRFSTTVDAAARNNLADAPVRLRDRPSVTQAGNIVSAGPEWFVNPGEGDLHLRSTAAPAIDKVPSLNTVTDDIDGEARPSSGADVDAGADELTTIVRPVITGISVADLDLRIEFTTAPGLSYTVESTRDLKSAWSPAQNDIPGSGAMFEYVTEPEKGEANRFFRIRAMR